MTEVSDPRSPNPARPGGGSPSFDSYSQNGEDVVLHRALRDVPLGRYIDVGAYHPVEDSVSMAFYALGWKGITVEPHPEYAELQRVRRPRDLQIEAAATDDEGATVTLHLVGDSGLSTLDEDLAASHAHSGYETREVEVRTRRLDRILEEAGWEDLAIHFMSVDTEGSERSVLEGIDLKVWRPWILVIEATAPNSTESTRDEWEDLVLDAGYRFCLFDGLSCYYVADEKAHELGPALSYPACVLDDYTTFTLRRVLLGREEMAAERDEAARERDSLKPLISEVVRWRTQAVSRWADVVSIRLEMERLRKELQGLQAQHHLVVEDNSRLRTELSNLSGWMEEMLRSSSWRVTRPLRALRTLSPGRGRT